MIEECRPIAKTKAWRVVQLVEKSRGRLEALAQPGPQPAII